MQHLDDAHGQAEAWMAAWLTSKPRKWRALIVKDVLARLRVILWCSDRSWESSRREIDDQLSQVASDYWSKSVLRGRDREHPDGAWQEQAWSAARRHETADRLRMLDRHLSKIGWFDAPTEPPWALSQKDAPPIALFYSFKGGAGRSTALAATALHLAAAGERVVVLDADLDAPGVGTLLAGYDGAVASCGITDYCWNSVFSETRPVSARTTTITGMRLMEFAGLERSSCVPRVASIADTWKSSPESTTGSHRMAHRIPSLCSCSGSVRTSHQVGF